MPRCDSQANHDHFRIYRFQTGTKIPARSPRPRSQIKTRNPNSRSRAQGHLTSIETQSLTPDRAPNSKPPTPDPGHQTPGLLHQTRNPNSRSRAQGHLTSIETQSLTPDRAPNSKPPTPDPGHQTPGLLHLDELIFARTEADLLCHAVTARQITTIFASTDSNPEPKSQLGAPDPDPKSNPEIRTPVHGPWATSPRLRPNP